MDLLAIIDPAKVFAWIFDVIRSVIPIAPEILVKIYQIAMIISIPLSFLFLYFILYTLYSRKSVERKMAELVNPPVKIEDAYIETAGAVPNDIRVRFNKIMELVNSENQNDWIKAIIDADIILDELLEINGYHGDSIGDKLKQVEGGDMINLDSAWEAHKVRNNIAHEPNFTLGQHEAKKTIEQFRKVFEEYGLI